ncbi:hypothetical protein ASE67_10210 [Sphingomonas sp. Leaf23]|uniref:hypothetical protein n=1 Tax=Sphingomonas sp. Leaf23 TaxID=1735689 RepID=UPI0006F4E0DF|nr:hypothetical protein [Sphingomonas sp. Leaf23]KQM86212.1 hypothetical protein ASE67_10210 [Sphingomonas sp. Leaf23]
MNPLQEFLARRAKRAPAQPVTNQGQPISREEFATLSLAVAHLIEDVETLSSPGKLGAVLNQAVAEITNGKPAGNQSFLAPKGDDVTPPPARTVANSGVPRTRPPLALPAFIAPKGD